jgi:hypothetical protein
MVEMYKSLSVVAAVCFVAGCSSLSSSSDPYERRAERERERQEKYVERAIENAPKWMAEVPKSSSAVYANGTAISSDMSMAMNKAKTIAFGKICMAAGGSASQQTKMFRLDTENAGTESSELAIKATCSTVDISGAEVVESKTIAEGTRFRTYVLVAHPVGSANAIQTVKEQKAVEKLGQERSREAFKEME